MSTHRTVYMKLVWKQVDVDENLAYRIFQERAQILYDTLSFAKAFDPMLALDDFWSKAHEVVRASSQRFLALQSDNAFGDLQSIYLTELPAALTTALSDHLPGDHDSVFALFQRYTRHFCRTLQPQSVEEHEFLAQNEPTLQAITTRLFQQSSIARQPTPLAGLDTELLDLPGMLLLENKDSFAYFNFDYEFGFKSFAESFSAALAQTPLNHTWSYNKACTEDHNVPTTLTIESVQLAVPPIHGELDNSFYEFLDDLKRALVAQGWVLLEITTGDQTQSHLLVPADRVTQVQRYLPHNQERRAQLFYGFLYDEKLFSQ